MAWAMVMIGVGAASAGIAGLFLPVGHRLAVALALVTGAGVGVTSLFLLMLAAGVDRPETAPKAFLISSGAGLIAVIAGLVVLWKRARSPRETRARRPSDTST